jgi:hypothetical protein
MFRHETLDVAKKSRAREAAKTQKWPSQPGKMRRLSRSFAVTQAQAEFVTLDAGLLLLQMQGFTESEEPLPIHLCRNITPCIKDRATTFFLSQYVLEETEMARGYFQDLPTLCNQPGTDGRVSVSIYAVGLAGLANITRSADLIIKARRQYICALRLTNAALKSPEESIKDSTLAAIMLLGMFETITCQGQRSFKSWNDHITGATALVKLRGHQQFQTRVGLKLFTQMNSNIITCCIQRGIQIPDDIIALRTYATSFLNTNDPAWRLSEVLILFASFQAAIKNGILNDPDSIIAAALQVDSEFFTLSRTMPPQWQHETIFTNADPELVYEGYCYLYANTWMAQIWSNLRVSRMFLNQIIVEQLRHSTSSPSSCPLPEKTIQYELATATLVEMSSGICATLPQQAGYLLSLSSQTSATLLSIPSLSSSQSQKSRAQYRESTATAVGCYFVLWPLFIVGLMSVASTLQRYWVINRLRFIGNRSGIQQAITLAEILERKERIEF